MTTVEIDIETARREFRDQLIEAGLLIPMGIDGLFGRGAVFENVIDGIDVAVRRKGQAVHGDSATVLRFPPLFSRAASAISSGVTGSAFEKSVLMRRQRVEKSASSGGRRHSQCMCSGSTTQARIANGRRARSCATHWRNNSMCRTSRSLPRRCSRLTVKNQVAPGVLARM